MRQTITLVALLVLIILACGGYFWFTGNVARRETLAADGKEPGASELAAAAMPPIQADTPAMPAARLGNTPSPAPAATADGALGDINDPNQRRSVCGYLAAQSDRLNYEFKQPLPPPVIDHIATEVEQARAQASRYSCVSGATQNSPSAHRRAPALAG
ncbi:MAG: hypothetical protein LBH10_07195 [Burkholderiaceae bacterium]|nr:hypothetical protein [Burkholderiaceae bacterium]